MTTTRAIAWNTGAQAIGKIISTSFGIAIIALMTRYLGQEGFGYYSTANTFFQIFAIILDLGINVMIVQMLGEHKGNEKYERRAVSATITFRIATSLVVLGTAPFIGLLLPYAQPVKIALFAISFSFFFASLNQIVIGVQQRHLKMHIVAISEVVGRAILFAGLIAAVALGWGLTAIVAIVSLGSLINLLINLMVARRYASFAWNWDVPFWKELLSRSWPIGVSILFNLAYFKADTFILSLVRPATEVGLYSAAYRVLEILITFPFMLAGVMLPLMSYAWAKKQHDKFAHLLRQSYTAMLLMAAPLLVGIIVVGTQTMVAISGPDFAASGQVLKILALAVAIIYFGTVSSHIVVAINAQKRMLPIYIVTAVFSVAGYALLIPIYGMWAAAWLTVVSELVVATGSTWFALRAAKNGLNIWSSIKILFCSALMGIIIGPLRNYWLPIPVIVGALVYSVLILVSGAVSMQTIKEILYLRKESQSGL